MIIIVKHFRLGSCNMVPAKKAGALEASKAGTTEKIQELLFDSDSEFSSLSEVSSSGESSYEPHEPKMSIFCHFRIQKLRKFAKFCFLLPILTFLHLEIGKKTSLIYFRLYYVHIYCSFALNVIIQ